MTIETNITNRRELANALAQYMNTRAVYLGPPTFAYQIGGIHLSREGILSGNDLDGIFPFLEMRGIIAAQPKLIQEPAGSTASGIQIPLEGYTPVNLRNLLSMLYSKQWLIRKACSMPALHIPESAVNSMPTDTLESAVQSLLDLKAAGTIIGVDITCNGITFAAEPYADLEAVQIFLQHVVQSAKAATRVYRKIIWRCNHKYNGQQKCTSPHVSQETLECAFEEVMRRMIAQREHVIAACRLAVKEVLDADDLRSEQEGLEEKLLLLKERIRRLVNDNARTEVDQEAYRREYDTLSAQYKQATNRIQEIDEELCGREARKKQIELFLRMFEKQKADVEFDSETFVAMVERVVIRQRIEGKSIELAFELRSGQVYRIKL